MRRAAAMMRFFAFVRDMVAADATAKAVGQIAMDAINKYFIPQLKRDLRKAEAGGREKEAARLSELIEDYARHADPRSPESKVFGDIVARVIQGFVTKWRLSPSDEDELAQLIALGFYRPNLRRKVDLETGEMVELPSLTGKTLMDYLRGHRVELGTEALERFWSKIVIDRARYMTREMRRKNPDTYNKVYDETEETEEPGEPGVVERQPDERGPLPFVRMEDEETQAERVAAQRRMRSYVRSHGDEVHLAMFDRIFELTNKGQDSISWKYDVYQPLIRKMRLPFKEGRMHEKMFELRALLSDALHADRSDAAADLLRNVKISSDVFVRSEFRRRLAAWMLGEEGCC